MPIGLPRDFENNLGDVNQMLKIGLKVTAKPIFPARCSAVKGICKIKAENIVWPKIGANNTPVVKSKIIVARIAKRAKFLIELLYFLKYKKEAIPTNP